MLTYKITILDYLGDLNQKTQDAIRNAVALVNYGRPSLRDTITSTINDYMNEVINDEENADIKKELTVVRETLINAHVFKTSGKNVADKEALVKLYEIIKVTPSLKKHIQFNKRMVDADLKNLTRLGAVGPKYTGLRAVYCSITGKREMVTVG